MCTSTSLFLQVHNLLEYGCSVYHGISMNLLHGLLLAVILYVQDHLNKIMKGGVKAVTSAMGRLVGALSLDLWRSYRHEKNAFLEDLLLWHGSVMTAFLLAFLYIVLSCPF